jgi:hypothetical protein
LAITLWFGQIFGEMASLDLVYTNRRIRASQIPESISLAGSEFDQSVWRENIFFVGTI